MVKGLYETEIQRLQREADQYTRALEQERKRFALVSDEFNQKQKTLDEIYASINQDI
jgi:DNA gyrase/topoisomerase IV subunit A